MERLDQAQASAIRQVIGLRLLPSGSFFGRPYQYIAAQDDEGMVYIRLLVRDWEAIVSRSEGLVVAAQSVCDEAGEVGIVITTADGWRVIDLFLAE